MRTATNIYHRKDGRYEARYVKGYDANGKKLYGSVFAKCYGEVKEKLERISPPPERFIPKSKLTVTEAVKVHIDSLNQQIKPSTRGIYQRNLENHIAPYFGNTRCDKLTQEKMQGFIDSLIENGLSAVTAQSVFIFLKASVTSVNASIFDVKMPKKKKPTVEFLSVDEQKRLEMVAKESGEADYIAIMLTLYTGVRLGELAGMMWCDIDFECGLLRVRRTMQRIRSDGETKTELALLPPKSESSERDIPLQVFLLELLRETKAKTDCEYIVSSKGKPIEPRSIQRRFKKLLLAAEVKEVNFHATRHTFATRILETGCDVKSLSEILGHSSAATTFKYAHSLDEHKRKCMNGLSEVFSRA